MAFDVSREKIETAEVVCDTAVEQAIEGEYSIPDYLPEIQRIVKYIAVPAVVQKFAAGSKATVEGFVLLTVFYTSSEGGALYSINQRLPFSRQFDLRRAVADGSSVSAGMRAQYMNCRASGARRLDFRGAYTLDIKVVGQFEREVICAVTGDGFQTLSQTESACQVLGAASRRFSLEDTFELQKQGDWSVLYQSAGVTADSVSFDSDTAVVSGKISLDALIKHSDGIMRYSSGLPFNQTVDLPVPHADEVKCVASAGIVSALVQPQPEQEGAASVNAAAYVDVCAVSKRSFEVVRDAFSTLYECETTVETMSALADVKEVAISYSIDKEFALQTEARTFLEGITVLTRLTQKENALYLSGMFYAFYTDAEDAVVCEDFPFETLVGNQELEASELWDMSLTLDMAQTTHKAGIVTLKAAGTAHGVLSEYTELSAAVDIQLDASLKKETNDLAVCVYYADEGESVFEIGKRYNTSVSEIMQQNGLVSGMLEDKKMLFIPIVG